MRNTRQNALLPYLLWAFGLAWALQIAASLAYYRGAALLYSGILSVSMFAPLAAALLSGMGLRGMGWKPRIRGNIRWILAAWFLPALLGAAGAALYYLLTPQALDLSMSLIRNALGATGAEQVSPQMYAVSGCIASLTYAPWINMLFAVGEEAGWRGAMYPALKARFGRLRGRILGGVIWGIWHWPIMLLTGYEYGMSYWGAPVTGPLLFCLIATAMGILLDALYEKTGSVWAPALCHGAINAFAGIPTLFLNPAYADRLLLGPLMIGVIGGLPLIALAVWICAVQRRTEASRQ